MNLRTKKQKKLKDQKEVRKLWAGLNGITNLRIAVDVRLASYRILSKLNALNDKGRKKNCNAYYEDNKILYIDRSLRVSSMTHWIFFLICQTKSVHRDLHLQSNRVFLSNGKNLIDISYLGVIRLSFFRNMVFFSYLPLAAWYLTRNFIIYSVKCMSAIHVA